MGDLTERLECVRVDFCELVAQHANELESLKLELEITRRENMTISGGLSETSDRLQHREENSRALMAELGAMKTELETLRHEKAVVAGILLETSDRLIHTEDIEKTLRAELIYKTNLCSDITDRLQTQQVAMNRCIVDTGQLVKQHISEHVRNLQSLPFSPTIYEPPPYQHPYQPLPHPPETSSPPISPVSMFPPPPHGHPLEFSLDEFGFGEDSLSIPFYQ